MQRSRSWFQIGCCGLSAMVAVCWLSTAAIGQSRTSSSSTSTESRPSSPRPDFRPHSEVLKDYEKVVSTADGQRSFYTIWTRKKDQTMLAELPRGYSSQRHFIAMTIASGDDFAGLQVEGDMYVYWRRFNKRMAMIEPNMGVRSTGDQESKDSVKRLFTDRVILDVPIVTIGPGGGPVIDMNSLLIGNASLFFGSSVRPTNSSLVTIKKAKAFPQNVELAFEVPTSSFRRSNSGRLQTLHYSISLIPTSSKYKPRAADERIGYFTTAYSDLGKYKDDEKRVRYINRWHLEKRDSKLKVSPPAKPIVFYIEHTTPVRYRRWVRQGILYWNKAFEKVGLSNAIEVYYQDSRLGAEQGHMDKDPEDVRWNFIRWLNNDIGTAIGPSRVNPTTGEILDADIVLTDGWIRHYFSQFDEVLPELALEGMSPETLAWLVKHPSWDPRIRLARPSQREHLKATLARESLQPYAGHEVAKIDSRLIGDQRFDGLIGRTSQVNGLCLATRGKAFDVAMMRMSLALLDDLDGKKGKRKKGKGKKKKDEEDEKDQDKKDEDKEGKEEDKDEAKEDDSGEEAKEDDEKESDEKKDEESQLDGMPESFIGPLIAELVAHEVGHTLGLRHNFKSSSIYPLADINSEKIKGQKPLAGSVMDYLPININMDGERIQGDRTMIGIGPYDHWAIEYGYTFKRDLKPILDRVAEPELQYATDEDTSGPDPLARRYDYSQNPLDYARNQMQLAEHHRKRIIDKFVEDGDSWSKARAGYELTLFLQTRSISMMANWIGGAFVHRDKKGDKDGRVPIEVVPAKTQRAALKFVIANAFRDKAFGLTTELLKHMTIDKWLDGDDFFFAFMEEPTWPVHDRIMGIQASALTMLMNPTTLKRVYDNEFRVPSDQDMITLPELLGDIGAAIWSELTENPGKKHTARQPMISSLRRNLQQEHLDRLITLAMPGNGSNEAYKPIANLALMELRKTHGKIGKVLTTNGGKIDPYTNSHLTKMQDQISKALKAEYIYNANDMRSPGGGGFIIFGKDADKE